MAIEWLGVFLRRVRGLLAALIIGLLSHLKVFDPAPAEYKYAPIIWLISLIGCVAGSYLTSAEAASVVQTFYKRVRPWGCWGPVRDALQLEPSDAPDQSWIRVIVNITLGITCLLSSYVSVFLLVAHFHFLCVFSILSALTSGILLYFTWYRELQRFEEESE